MYRGIIETYCAGVGKIVGESIARPENCRGRRPRRPALLNTSQANTIKATLYEVAFYYFGGAGGAAVGISLPKPTDRYTTKIR